MIPTGCPSIRSAHLREKLAACVFVAESVLSQPSAVVWTGPSDRPYNYCLRQPSKRPLAGNHINRDTEREASHMGHLRLKVSGRMAARLTPRMHQLNLEIIE